MARSSPPPPQNRLLAALPKKEYQRFLPHLERVSLGVKEVVYEPNEPIQYVYFPLTCVFSMVATLHEGRSVEVATLGSEGMVGLPVFLGAKSTPLLGFSQVAGEAMRMDAVSFQKQVALNGPLTALLHRYTQTLMVQIAQGTACNRAHNILQRCARWLLMTQDRVKADSFTLTQEFLGQMLGVRRAGVNEVASELQKRGLIRYRRGIIEIVDRKGLEAISCDCYRIIREEFDRLLTDAHPQRPFL